jgi:xanthine phosphoribosyltransferase
MEKLRQRILEDGRSLPGGILKVDSFLNHQLDPNLMMDIAKEMADRLKGYPINKIVTIEASGIAPAIMLGYVMQLPVVFIKKKSPKTMSDFYLAEVHSFTKNRWYSVCIANEFLSATDHIVFVDDFLAYGNAARGVIDLCCQSGTTIEAMAFIIEKSFQGGGDKLRAEGYDVISLATVDSLDNCQIKLR